MPSSRSRLVRYLWGPEQPISQVHEGQHTQWNSSYSAENQWVWSAESAPSRKYHWLPFWNLQGEEACQLEVKCSIYHILLLLYMFFFCTSIMWSSCLWSSGAWQWTRIRRRVILGSNYEDTSSIYKKIMHCLQLTAKLWRWTTCEGLCLQKKKCVYQALSLSLLHWKREQEERSGGVGPWLGPTTQLPFSANTFHTWLANRLLSLVRGQYWLKRYLFQNLLLLYIIFKIFLSTQQFINCPPDPAGIQVVISSQRTVSIEKIFISEFTIAVHNF